MEIRTNKRGHKKVKFTAEEQKAMNEEIENQLLEFVGDNLLEIEALMMVQLREQLHFGKKRLKRFYMGFMPSIYDFMVNRIKEGGDKSSIERLSDYGVPIEEWALEREKLLND